MQEDGNIMDFYVNGDAAPGGRFNFVYNTNQITGIGPVAYLKSIDPQIHNYPNPFRDETTIEFHLQGTMNIGLLVYNSMGQQISTLSQESRSGGIHRVSWSGCDDSGNQVGPGLYYYRLVTDHGTMGTGSMLKLEK